MNAENLHILRDLHPTSGCGGAALRGMYRRRRTLYEHQDRACTALGFHSLIEARRRGLVYALREELT